ncbi:hypothetical protein GCM10010344_05320 [Streptomyces bluensis]|nr:DUF485 domain-containing protein [Streptomyces bluensis]GGZ43075.1 hypothetical protein GCM10010344_05320 [Streptomyces bluensis]
MSQHHPPHGGYAPPPPTGYEPAGSARSAGSQAIYDDPEFHSLRRAYRSFGAVAVLLSVGGFLSYVLLSSFAPALMNQELFGRLTLGLALGLVQFLVMGVATWCYVRHMRERVDPIVLRLRAQQREQEREQEQARVAAGRRFRAW